MDITERMKELGIDPGLSYRLLDEINAREKSGGSSGAAAAPLLPEAGESFSIPALDGSRVLDMRKDAVLRLSADDFGGKCQELALPDSLASRAEQDGAFLRIDRSLLRDIGLFLLPKLAYGVLNGGSASSYVDQKKNRDLNPRLFEILSPQFNSLEACYRGRAKGLTPAFINADGSPGPSFIELKMRSLLLLIREYQGLYGKAGEDAGELLPFFQMTSILNDTEIARTYQTYRNSPLLAGLAEKTGRNITAVLTGIQPLVAAFTHKDDGFPRKIFTRAWGRANEPLPFPGGHGQNFLVLREVYQKLYTMGKRYVYLGNVDNLGSTPDPAGLAVLALTGKQGAFDFSFKTAVDVKGGILVETSQGRLDCVDIGAAVSKDWVAKQEGQGKAILFNCATGLFDLKWLTDNLDRIIRDLPLRVSEHDKDPGKYAQTEQITWEVLSMMDDILIYGVDKYERFLASKMLLENFMISGLELDNPGYPEDFGQLSRKMHQGLNFLLKNVYGLTLRDRRWVKDDGIEEADSQR